MQVSLDAIIFVIFLLLNLIVVLFYSRGIKDGREYALGKREFSTTAVTLTIVATCIGSGTFSIALAESYRQGLYFIIPTLLGDLLMFSIVGYFLVPRMREFMGIMSVAEAMGELYGKSVRVVTAISEIIVSITCIALQFKVASYIMQIFFDISGFYAMISSAVVVILYSAFGGIKAVTFTDILQFFTFATIIPLICIVIWSAAQDSTISILQAASADPLLNLQNVFDISNSRFLSSMYLLLIFIIPALRPAIFQRISMSSNLLQAQKSCINSGLIITAIYLVTCWMGVILHLTAPNLNPDNIIAHIINTYTYPGLKGLTVIGIMSAIMSTADSHINSASILFMNDIIQPLNPDAGADSAKPKKELLLLRITSCICGIAALVIGINSGSILKLFIQMLSFYMPIVSVPLLLAILGFRSSSTVVLAGMTAGAMTILALPYFGNFEVSLGVIGMLANLIVFIIAHFLCGRPKNPMSPIGSNQKHGNALKSVAEHIRQNFSGFLSSIQSFSLREFDKKDFANQQSLYVPVGFIGITMVLSTSQLVSQASGQCGVLLNFIYGSTLFCSFILITHPIWPPTFIKPKLTAVLRMIVIPYITVFASCILVLVSQFGQFQIMVFLANVLVLALLERWQVALAMLLLGSYGSYGSYGGYQCYDIFAKPALALSINFTETGLQFKIIYILLLISSILIAFLRPRQNAFYLSEEMREHLSHIVQDQAKEIDNLSGLKNEFLRNLQHETNTPLTGVYSMSQALNDCYDKLNDRQRKDTIAIIMHSSERLISYVHNLVDVSKLIRQEFKPDVRNVNLSKTVEEAVRKCKRFYITNEDEDTREIIVNVEPGIMVKCDEYLIKRSFENLITNAIQYCKRGAITITLTKIQNTDQNQSQAEDQNRGSKIIFSVKDEGIGIPPQDLSSIFEPFTTSSKTRTPAGGRGVGLALVREVVRLHKGTVTAESNNEKAGSLFTLNLPVL